MVRQMRDKTPETEKITLNLGHVDLGRIDLLVREGFYANRSDFIRLAIRNRLDAQDAEVRGAIERQAMHLGLRDITRSELEQARAKGETLHLRVVGLARIAPDVTADLARQTIGALTVLGALQASDDIRAALADRLD